MIPRHLTTGLAVALSSTIIAGGAFAQDAQIEDLTQRISALEAELAEQPRLSFSGLENTTIELYGFIRVEAFYDGDFQQGDFSRTSRIGEPAFATDGAFDTSVRVSRFGIRSATETGIGTIGTQFEFDLFGSGGDDTGSPNLRLRHANVTIGDEWLIGQFWTNFMPLGEYPRTADFNGPVGITFARVPQVRYSGRVSDELSYSVSIEEATGNSTSPRFTAAALYDAGTWRVRAAGIAGNADSDINPSQSVSVDGITLSGSVQPWAGGTLSATFVDGEGIGSLLIGGGADVVGGVANGVTGYTLEARQDIGSAFNVGIAYGNEEYDLATNTGTLDFIELETIHLNAFYTPVENLTLALEFITGERTTSTGQTFDADRIGASVTFSF